jgi:transcriptional regulator with XRE-family HTH domain
MMAMAKKSPDSTDVHVGSQIRTRRQELGMSQEKLADGLGLTFQQVQKYEKGTNRVGASRLQAISALLQVPISFFFEDASPPSTRKKAADGPSDDFVTEFLKSGDSDTLMKAFLRIKAPEVRRSIVHMVEAISNSAH